MIEGFSFTNIKNKGNYLQAYARAHVTGNIYETMPVMLDPTTKEMLTLKSGQPLSYVKKTLLKWGPLHIALVHCLGHHDDEVAYNPKDVIYELNHKKVLFTLKKKQNQPPPKELFEKDDDPQWELMRH